MKLSFLIPVYNKESTIFDTISSIVDVAHKLQREFEIIVCDDASTDKSRAEIKRAMMEYPHVQLVAHVRNAGFAQAYFTSARQASGDMLLYISADNDMTQASLMKLWKSVKKGVVVNQYYSNMGERPYFRRTISSLYTSILNLIYGLDLKYYNGSNIYPVEFVKSVKDFDSSFSFQAELLVRALGQYPLVEVATICLFNDEKTSIFRLKNILGVLNFIMFKSWRLRVG